MVLSTSCQKIFAESGGRQGANVLLVLHSDKQTKREAALRGRPSRKFCGFRPRGCLFLCREVLVACKALLGSLFGLLEELLCNGGLRLLEGSVARLAEDERLVVASACDFVMLMPWLMQGA